MSKDNILEGQEISILKDKLHVLAAANKEAELKFYLSKAETILVKNHIIKLFDLPKDSRDIYIDLAAKAHSCELSEVTESMRKCTKLALYRWLLSRKGP